MSGLSAMDAHRDVRLGGTDVLALDATGIDRRDRALPRSSRPTTPPPHGQELR